MNDRRQTLAILGATGDLGGGLAYRWARAGHPIVIGSRSAEKAAAAAGELVERVAGATVRGLDNVAAAAAGEIVVLTVPFAHQRPILEAVREELRGKILVDTTVPLRPPKVGTVVLPEEGAAALVAQEIVGQEVQVVSAFQNVGAAHLQEEGEVDCDVLVTGDAAEARQRVLELVESAGLRGFDAGPLANAAAAEALTSVLIHINRRYRIAGAGIRITGRPRGE